MIRTKSRLATLSVTAGAERYHNYSVVGLGDSLTYGYGGEEPGGPYTPYLNQLATYMEWRPYVNLGVSGQTSTQILARWALLPQYYDHTVINWSGRNDIAGFGTGWSTTTIANLDSFVAIQQSAGNDRYILFGVTNNGSENPTIGGTGTTNYNAIVAHNAACAARYGSKFFDIRSWMVNDALDALGLTPTSDDLADIALDMIPRQLRRDATNVHFNSVGNAAIAYKVAELIEALDAAEPVNVLTFPNLASIQGDGTLGSGQYLTAYDGLKLGDPATGSGVVLQGNPRQKLFMVGGGQSIPSTISAATTREWAFFGPNAGGTAATGRAMTGIGADVAPSLTTGSFSLLGGTRAGNALTTGSSHVLLGVDAGASLTTQSSYVAVGRYVFGSATSNTPSVGIGFQVGFALTTGSMTGGGYQALRNVTTGNGNTAWGEQAGYTAIDGGNNTYVGKYSGYSNVSANGQTAVGMRAGYLATADGGTFVGFQAGDNLTTGTGCLIIGNNIDFPSATKNYQLNIQNIIFGSNIDGTGTTISSGKIGIGTTSPVERLDVAGAIRSDTGFYGIETTAPAAPGTNGFRIYAEDNGSGRTRLMVIFQSGAAQLIAEQP